MPMKNMSMIGTMAMARQPAQPADRRGRITSITYTQHHELDEVLAHDHGERRIHGGGAVRLQDDSRS
eukprot:16440752-Heterocapsa_arctica.AAC.1